MCKTFFALLDIADINHEQDRSKEIRNVTITTEIAPKDREEKKESFKAVSPSLQYNIQIHLPAPKDIEVYNAIFKSIKEHLIG
ncbi:hypothetical protein [Ornithinibacillus bavariensis]|uniref:Uncharacterized protein n=1 Tax=Ornithinibacillus bavariensis TaxID=545502 RepID=A0A919XD09_9BACI|nr:hypothetical protein [Ornithinibacillus bavariensis]GIO28278.1 hypothetical protein J43TS3_28890 [Ornithinibacillus bavariensis]